MRKKRIREAAFFTGLSQADIVMRSKSGRVMGLATLRRGLTPIEVKAVAFKKRSKDRVDIFGAGKYPYRVAAWYYKTAPHEVFISNGPSYFSFNEAFLPYVVMNLLRELKRRGLYRKLE